MMLQALQNLLAGTAWTSAEIHASSRREFRSPEAFRKARRLHRAGGMASVHMLLAGILIGVVLGGSAVLVFADEPTLLVRNGVLKGWAVTRDNESLVCTDPTIFVRAKQIECE